MMRMRMDDLPVYQVRAWTDLRGESNADRVRHVERMAQMCERKMRELCPKFEPLVKAVTVRGKPQLLFQANVPADRVDEARRRASYWFKRGLTTRVASGRGGRLRLDVPWGKMEVQRVG